MSRATPFPDLAPSDGLLADLGDRVRAERRRIGMTRAELAAASDVSLRYLAQLEAGAGNISIALLSRVAGALDQTLAALLIQPGARDVAALFETAPQAVQDKVLALLSPDGKAAKMNRLCLVGLRGAGKSTLGAGLGARLNLPFVELSELIEEAAGMPQAEIMALYGAEGFRRFESEALDEVIASYDAVVLAVAGGIVGTPETYERLLTRFNTVWVRATPDAHMSRVVAQGDTRPMEGNPRALERIAAILTERGPEYARADATLDTTGKSPAEALDALDDLVRQRELLPQQEEG